MEKEAEQAEAKRLLWADGQAGCKVAALRTQVLVSNDQQVALVLLGEGMAVLRGVQVCGNMID